MMKFRDKGEEYLNMYPNLRSWINECIVCHTKGYKPDLPDQIYPHYSVAADNLRRFFKPLELTEDGMCEICNKAIKKK